MIWSSIWVQKHVGEQSGEEALIPLGKRSVRSDQEIDATDVTPAKWQDRDKTEVSLTSTPPLKRNVIADIITQAELEHLTLVLHPESTLVAVRESLIGDAVTGDGGEASNSSSPTEGHTKKVIHNGKFYKVSDREPLSITSALSKDMFRAILATLGLLATPLSSTSEKRRSLVKDLEDLIEHDFRCVANEERETALREQRYMNYTHKKNSLEQDNSHDNEIGDDVGEAKAALTRPSDGEGTFQHRKHSVFENSRNCKNERRHGRQLHSTDIEGKENVRYLTQVEDAGQLEDEESSQNGDRDSVTVDTATTGEVPSSDLDGTFHVNLPRDF